MKVLDDWWSSAEKDVKCLDGTCLCEDHKKSEQFDEAKKTAYQNLVSTLNKLWTSPVNVLDRYTEEELNQMYTPDGVCRECRILQQEYIDHGKAAIPKDATLSQYTEEVAQLKEQSVHCRCHNHGGYDPIVMEKVTLD